MSVAPLHDVESLSVQDYLDRYAVEQPDKAFLVDVGNGEVATFSECHQQVCRIANTIGQMGVKPGDPVAYAFGNSKDSALVILALLYGGYLATAVNLVAGESTIEYVLEHSEAKLVIADEDAAELLKPILAAAGSVPLISRSAVLEKAKTASTAVQSVSALADGLLMYTSGTTGRPKGVVHTQSSLLAGGRNTAEAHGLQTDDRGLCVLPFYHINAFCVSLMGSLVSGSSIVIPSRFSVKSFWDQIRQHKCSWFSVVPTQISYLLHNAENAGGDATGCTKLRFGRSASAPLSPEMHEAFEARFGVPVIETMGLTETAAQILSNPLPPATRKIGSPGVAFGNEVIIGDSNQNEVTSGEEGEILVRGGNVLSGYLKNPEATAEAITKSGWLRTGDLGRMDEDGYVFVTGRLKELIIKGGENIAPREVDEALYCHEDVMEAAAFPVPCKDYGQRVEAAVKLSETSNATEQELLALCMDKLGKFKSPDRIHILEDLPKGPSGKIQRIKLIELI